MTSLTKQLLEASDILDLLSPEDGAEVNLILTMLRNKRIDLISTRETLSDRLLWHDMKFADRFSGHHIEVVRSITDKFDYTFKISVGHFFIKKKYHSGNGNFTVYFAIKHPFRFADGSFRNDGSLRAKEYRRLEADLRV